MTAFPVDPLVRVHHLVCALGVSTATFHKALKAGRIPQPDARYIIGNGKVWRLSTIRTWNPTIADAVEVAVTHPAFTASALAHAA